MIKSLTSVLILLVSAASAPGGQPLFDPDPNHPWNRLREALFVRAADHGFSYAREELEPPLQALSRHLLEGPSHERAVAVLDDFLKQRADQLIRDPIKRAVLQRDLWTVFGTTAGTGNLRWWQVDEQVVKAGIEDTGDEQFGRKRARRGLQRRLVAVMRRIALSADEIAALPDNLSIAGRSGVFPAAYDPAHPQQAFLPADLTRADGPWVLVGNKARADGLAAPAHVQFTNGRSLFLVFIRLPQGRDATTAYLGTLTKGKFEQFPEGTQVALVRRMLQVDKDGNLCLAPVTEEVQFRVFQSLTDINAFELLLDRKDLFAAHGGLRAVAPDEASYYDISGFHGGSPNGTRDLLEVTPRKRPPVVMDCCLTCHRVQVDGGIRSVASAFASDRRHIDLEPAVLDKQVESALNWTKKTYSWGLLQGLWEANP
jgi:hypothetical protein